MTMQHDRKRTAFHLPSAITSLILASALLGSACAPPQAPSNAIVVGTVSSFETPNELIARGSHFNDTIVDRLFLPLLEEVPDYTTPEQTLRPRAAESWEVSDDRLRVTFKLREGLVWSDGTPMTAEDVRFTWQAQTSPEVGWVYSDGKKSISNVEVIDDRTVVFHFSERIHSPVIEANEGVIIPKHVWSRIPFSEWRQQPEFFQQNIVSSGPFLFDSWTRDQRLVLTRNPLYYEPGLPKLDQVVFQFIREPAALTSQIISGGVDMTYGTRASDVPELRDSPEVELIDYRTRQFTFVSWNVRRPQFSDPRVRRALALASNRQAIVDTLWFGYGDIGTSPVVSWIWAYNPKLEPWPYDPDAAAKLLDEAGWVDSDGDGIRDKDGQAFSFELTTTAGNAIRWDAAQMLKADYAKVGIDAKPRRLEYDTLSALNREGDYDATIMAFLMDTTLDLGYALHSDSIDNGYNFGAYSNSRVDELVDQYAAVENPEDGLTQLHEIQDLVHQEQPMLFLWEPRNFVSVRGLENVRPDMLSEFANLREWTRAPQAP